MALDPVAAFMLGIIVGQWLGILLILKVVKAVLNRPSGVSTDTLDPSEQAAVISRLVSRFLPGSIKPRSSAAKRTHRPAAKKSKSAGT